MLPAGGTLADARRMLDMAAHEVDHVVRAARQLHVFTQASADSSAPSDDAHAASAVRWREMRRYLDVGVPGVPWRWIAGVARA